MIGTPEKGLPPLVLKPTDPASRAPIDYALADRPTLGSKRTVRERWHRVLASIAARRRPEKSRRRLEKLAAIRPLGLDEMAFTALLFLRRDEPQRAYDLLVELREALKGREGAGADYVRRYVLSWLCQLRFDPFNADAHNRAAAAIDCSRELKAFLWLPSGQPRTDALDAEFDKWMKANHPSEGDLRKRRA